MTTWGEFHQNSGDGVVKRNSPQVDHVSRREAENDKHGYGPVTVEQARLMEMFYRLECSVSNAHSEDVREGCWNYIPYSHLRFYQKLKDHLAERGCTPPFRNDLRFLEMGCGLGTKLYIAAHWCNIGTVDGLEINPYYCNIAQNMLGHRGKVYCADVREFTDYGNYDIIYSYGEVRGGDINVQEKVREAMKPGAVLLRAFLNAEIRSWEKPK